MSNPGRDEAREQAELLKAAGHAVSYSEAFESGKFQYYTFTHYSTCRVCETEREKQHGKDREVGLV